MESDLVRWKWKCVLCKKVVSSRQSALKHMGIYHPSENISGNITKIQTNDGSKKVNSKKTSIKRAVSFSSTLSNMFDIIAGLKVFLRRILRGLMMINGHLNVIIH